MQIVLLGYLIGAAPASFNRQQDSWLATQTRTCVCLVLAVLRKVRMRVRCAAAMVTQQWPSEALCVSQLGNADTDAFLNNHASGLNESPVDFTCGRDARRSVVDTVDTSSRREVSELGHGSPAAASDIENGIVLSNRQMLKSPVGQLGVASMYRAREASNR
jgi:hypothetical protein